MMAVPAVATLPADTDDDLLSAVELAVSRRGLRPAGVRRPHLRVAALVPALIFRKGLDLKHEVAGQLAESYHSQLVNQIKAQDYCHRAGRLTVHLAREFGFCYGVDRAVDYAYQARRRFPERRVFLTGEIIHNPHVNDQLRTQGIRFLSDPVERGTEIGADDVVILPAFGVTIAELQRYDGSGCTLVDTTCARS